MHSFNTSITCDLTMQLHVLKIIQYQKTLYHEMCILCMYYICNTMAPQFLQLIGRAIQKVVGSITWEEVIDVLIKLIKKFLPNALM